MGDRVITAHQARPGTNLDPAEFSALRPQRAPNIDVVLFALEYAKGCPNSMHSDSSVGPVIGSSSIRPWWRTKSYLTSLDAGAVSYVTKWESGSHVKNAIYGGGFGHALRAAADGASAAEGRNDRQALG